MLSSLPRYSAQPDLRTCPFCALLLSAVVDYYYYFFLRRKKNPIQIKTDFIPQKHFAFQLLKEVAHEGSAARLLGDLKRNVRSGFSYPC